MKEQLKRLLKQSVYQTGLLNLYHKIRNRNSLTVVLFHRVLPQDDPRYQQADPVWTVTDTFFKQSLQFFKRHYNVISISDLIAAQKGKALPERALLITFDDGWADNLEIANTLTEQEGIRPLLFVTTGAIDTPVLSWQETLFSCWRAGILTDKRIKQINTISGKSLTLPKSDLETYQFIHQLQQCNTEQKQNLLMLTKEWTTDLAGTPLMLTKEQLQQLAQRSFDMGTHGVIHEPLSQVDNPKEQLVLAMQHLNDMLASKETKSMSFPHGVVSSNLINDAFQSGYPLVFTGDTVINHSSLAAAQVLGRFNIEQADLEDRHGQLNPAQLALFLFRQTKENANKKWVRQY